MVFGISGVELVILAVLALLVFGPDKLPGVAQDAGRMIRQLRKMAQEAREEVSGVFPELSDLGLDNISDLDPRQYVRKQLLEEKDDLDAAIDGKPTARSVTPPVRAAQPRPEPVPPEATRVADVPVPAEPTESAESPAPWDADAT